MTTESQSKIGRRGFFRIVGAGAAAGTIAPLAPRAAVARETDDEKRKARYRESDEVKTYYRVNRYPPKT